MTKVVNQTDKFWQDLIKYDDKFGWSELGLLEEYLLDAWQMALSKNSKTTSRQFFNIIKRSMKLYNSFFDNPEGMNSEFNMASYIYNCVSDDIYSESDSKRQAPLQTYFKEIGEIYERDKNDGELEYIEENREKYITQNLKLVISIAKRYQGLGVDLEGLISAGNEGLCHAWSKYKPGSIILKNQILESLEMAPDELSRDFIDGIVGESLSYGNLKDVYDEAFADERVYDKDEVINWLNTNIKSAKFSSVASMWIRAYIMIELNKHSRIVSKPSTEIKKDKDLNGSYTKEVLVGIDKCDDDEQLTNYFPKSDTDIMEEVYTTENYKIFMSNISDLLSDVCSRDRRILFKNFGIGLPRAMTQKEISNSEGLTATRISQILQNTITILRDRCSNKDMHMLYELLNLKQD